MKRGQIVFVVNLLQDINILRPLAYIAARDMGRRTLFLVTGGFRKRDKNGVWQQELAELARETHADVFDFNSELEALRALRETSGMLIAGSESCLNAHKPVHDLFRVAPGRFQKVTLQHGFECVGFLQSRDHDLAHGTGITFAADIICGWCEPERLTSLAPSQRHKLYVAGPPAVLQMPPPATAETKLEFGLVCENLHSPRLKVAGDFKTDFLGIFGEYCAALKEKGQKIALRPHPGGQYTLKNSVPLPDNVELSIAPMYKTDLSRYTYGISAPSSILIDMVLAGIPTAVWQDQSRVLDLGNYEGLTRISSLKDWLDFSREAVAHPGRFLDMQRRFTERQRMPTSRETVFQRYAELLACSPAPVKPVRKPDSRLERILYIANAYIPTLQISFVKPLDPLTKAGDIVTDLISEQEMKRRFKQIWNGESVREWIEDRFLSFKPTLVVFCRYSGPHASRILELAQQSGVPQIYHIDDDLLHVPEEIGQNKFQYHNDPSRISAVRYLLDHVTLVYCSTERLRARLTELSVRSPIVAGDINCSGQVISPAKLRTVRKIGYMGIGHERDLASVLPVLTKFLRNNPNITFELFGTIPMPEQLKEFGDRVTRAPKIDNYEEFMRYLASIEWDIGICPLTPINFNMMKSNNKWIEYSSVGAAVVASRGTVYDECCADGCGVLVATEDEWYSALDRLVRYPDVRFDLVRRAQDKLARSYSTERLREQVLNVFRQAHTLQVESKLREFKQ